MRVRRRSSGGKEGVNRRFSNRVCRPTAGEKETRDQPTSRSGFLTRGDMKCRGPPIPRSQEEIKSSIGRQKVSARWPPSDMSHYFRALVSCREARFFKKIYVFATQTLNNLAFRRA